MSYDLVSVPTPGSTPIKYGAVTTDKVAAAAPPDPVARSNQQAVQPVSVKPRLVSIVGQSPKGLDSNGNRNAIKFTMGVDAGNSLYQGLIFTDTTTNGFTHAKLAYTIYLDTVDFSNAWPFGTNVDVSKHDIRSWESANKFVNSAGTLYYIPTQPNEAFFWMGIKNSDSVHHDYLVFATIRFISNSTSTTQ